VDSKESYAFARFMLSKGHMIGHVCNLPDISWRSLEVPLGPDGQPMSGTILDPTVGDEAHFINPENFGFKNDDGSPATIKVPLKYAEVEKIADGAKKPNMTAHQTSGSNWWRTQQLYSLAIDHGTTAVSQIEGLVRMQAAYDFSFGRMSAAQKAVVQTSLATEISGCSQDKDACKADLAKQKDNVNHSLRSMLIAMGIMGHFVGDAGQPFHNSADYNGKESGHYGIHSYYEAQIVDQIPASLQAEVYAAGLADSEGYVAAILAEKDPDPSFSGDPYNVIARMRKLSDMAGQQMASILAIEDSVPGFQKGTLHKSVQPKGRPFADALKTSYPDQYKLYHDRIVGEIGVSARILAKFWDEIDANLDEKAKAAGARLAPALGDEKLAKLDYTKYYTTFDYPLDSPYIPPAYLVGGLSLQPLPAGVALPPPASAPKTKPQRLERAGADAEDLDELEGVDGSNQPKAGPEKVDDVVTGVKWLWRHSFGKKK
jgi:hypothetical protein